MSTIKEITALRREGKIRDAFIMAVEFLKDEPGEWSKTAMFWVLRDMTLLLIAEPTEESRIAAERHLKIMEELQPYILDDSGAGVNAILKIKKALVPHYEELKQCSELSKTNPIQAYKQAVLRGGTQAKSVDVLLHEDFGWILYRYLRSRINELTSLEVRGLLRDYIVLRNERPSMLHSMLLNFALNFSKSHSDFIFPNFLQLWGVSNFRSDDLVDGHNNNGDTIPSLISRVCAQLSMTDTFLIEDLSEGTGLRIDAIVNMHRKQWFWSLFELQKTNNIESFWRMIDSYTIKLGSYPATKWHSEILKLATRRVEEVYSQHFLNIVLSCKKAGFYIEDWKPRIGKDWATFPPFIQQFVKRCYELIKAQYSLRRKTDLLEGLAYIYDLIEERNVGDEWTSRQRAILSVWLNHKQDAFDRYRNLLKTMGGKFYIWQEISQCVENDSLRVGFLLRALELERTEDLIGSLRLETAEILVKLCFFGEAKKLLDVYASHRKKHNKPCSERWKITEEIIINSKLKDKGVLDKKKAIFNAMDYAYADYPWEEYVLNDRFVLNNRHRIAFTNGEFNFVVSPKRFGISEQVELGTIVKIRCVNNGESIIPLMLKLTDLPKWSTLPEDFGYVVYVNEVKSAVSIVTSKSEESFFFDQNKAFKTHDFISFRYYLSKRKQGAMIEVVNPKICTREIAMCHFKQRIVVVDNVNQQKALFHIVMGSGLVSAIVRFKDTKLRPTIGDFLKLSYCIRKNKEGKKRVIIIDLNITDEINDKLIKNIEGWLTLNSNTPYNKVGFGFVCDTYVPRKVLLDEGILENCRVKATAVINGDGKWKVFKLEKI